MEVDANGVIQSGPFQGHHIDELERYADDLQKAIAKPPKDGATPPVVTPPKAPAVRNPDGTLAEHADARVSGLHITVLQRMVADDEAEAARTLPDYATYKPKIDAMKKTLNDQALIQKGVHRMLYGLVKSEDDPATRKVLFNEDVTPTPPPVVPGEKKEGDEPPAVPPAATKTPTPEDLISQVKQPKPATPPVATPTGGRVAPDAGDRKPKLKATEKLERAAKAMGRDIKSYLLELEDNGTTQETIDNASIKRSEQKRSSRIFAMGGQS